MGDATTGSGGYKSPPLFKSGVHRGVQTAAQAGGTRQGILVVLA